MAYNESKFFLSTWRKLFVEYHKALYLDPYFLTFNFFILGETNVCNCADDTGLHACDKDLMI